jgi:hypothetical protein
MPDAEVNRLIVEAYDGYFCLLRYNKSQGAYVYQESIISTMLKGMQ